MTVIPHVPLPISSLLDSDLLKENLGKRNQAVSVHTMKAYGGSGGTSAPIPNLLTSRNCRYTRGNKEFRYPSNRRLGGPHLLSGYLGEKIRNPELQV